MTCRKTSESSEAVQPESQPANAVPPVSVNQLSLKQTLSIKSMYKLSLGKKIFLATPLVYHCIHKLQPFLKAGIIIFLV